MGNNKSGRKIKRRQEKHQKRLAEQEMATKVAMFGKLPEQCGNCSSPFDKTDREQVMSWTVVVREEQDKVNLWCPTCWQSAQQMLAEIQKDLSEAKNED